MSKISFASLTSCIMLGSVACSLAIPSETAQSQLVQVDRTRQLDGPESVVAKFHQAIQNRDFNSLDKYYCSAEKTAAQKLNRLMDPNGRNMALLNAYLQISSRIHSINMSQLYYETKYLNERSDLAVVAITGNVIVSSLNGQTLVLPYRRFSTFGRDWLRLIKENNKWKLCYNLTELPETGITGENGSTVFYTNSRITTTISVNLGDTIKVQASGTVRFGAFAGSGGPHGISFRRNYNFFANIPHGQLIGRIKQSGMQNLDGWFPIGQAREFVARTSGVLEFAVNDNQPGDNTGRFRIEVNVDRAKAISEKDFTPGGTNGRSSLPGFFGSFFPGNLL
ncbi:MAG: hypothetical protein HC866_03975, partial [Leptolyngbyaceae cyanobacterium RU_5_1]|nr:hypothetical protein [Leptolyngbyaceae cyanobacterium RU_5_1]